MPLAARLASSLMRLKAAVGVFRGDLSPDVQAFLAGILPGSRGEPPPRTTADFLKAYSTMPWLRAVVGKVSTGVASVTWRLYAARPPGGGRALRKPLVQRAGAIERRTMLKALQDTEELTEIEDHPLLDVLNGTNGYLVGLSLRQLSEVYLMLVGEYFWLKERNGLGMPVAVWPLPPNWVTACPTPEFPFYQVSFRAWSGNVPATEILWATHPDPANPYGRGVSVSQALADELETDEYAARHMKAFFYNRARPDLIVSAPGLQPGETRRLEEDWLNKHRGFWSSFKPFFLNREVQIKEITQSFDDLQMVQLRQHERDTVLQVLAGIPPEMLGIITNSNRATIDAADHLFAKFILVPRCEFQREILQTRLVPEYDARLILDYDDPVPKDREYELRAASAAPWALNMDEWRELSGHAPKENGQGEVHGVPLGIQFRRPEDLEDEEPAIPVIPPAPPRPAPAAPAEDAASMTRRMALARAQDALTRLQQDRTRLRQKLNWVDQPADDPFYLAVHRIADRLTPPVRQRFLDAVARMRGSFNEAEFIGAVTAGNVDAALGAIPLEGFAETFAHVERELHAGVVASGEQAAQHLTSLGFEMSFNLMDPGASAWARNHAAELVTQVTTETQAAIRALVVNALDTGVPPRDLARQIQPLLGLTERQTAAIAKERRQWEAQGYSEARIERNVADEARKQLRDRSYVIARTETLNSTNQGQLTAWEQAQREGLIDAQQTMRVWITTPDERTCPDCEPLDGMEAPLNEPFENGLMAPTLHPSCRCTVSLSFKGET